MFISPKKTRVSLSLPSQIVEEIKQYSKNTHSSQSKIVAQALDFWLKCKIDQDSKELAKLTFDDLPSEEEWLSIQSKIS